jgi:hypothetical protein
MRGSVFKSGLVVLAAGGLVGMGMSSASASTCPPRQVVDVVGTADGVHLSQTSVKAGVVSFTVSSTVAAGPDGGGSEVSLFRPAHGASLDKVMADFQDEFSQDPQTAAKGTQELTHDAVFRGLADVVPGTPLTVTESLPAGHYFVFDGGSHPPVPFTVTPSAHGRDGDAGPDSAFTVKMTSDDKFIAPRKWSHRGTVTVANVSDTLHFMNLVPVAKGTTDDQIQQFFASGAQGAPPFADPSRPSVGSDVESPGQSLQLSYDLPPGTYALLCFVADDETGMPHAMMGMHKVVVLH